MFFDIKTREFLDLQVDENKVAFYSNSTKITWRELRANVESRVIKFRSLLKSNNSPIILIGEKEIDYVISIIACLIIKIPYIPIDATIAPPDRIKQIAKISNSQFFYYAQTNSIKNNDFYMDINANNENLAYIMFTSGSTGDPKGVKIPSEALEDFCEWLLNDFELNSNNVWINQARFSFDLSMFEFYGTLITGGTCVLTTPIEQTNIHEFSRIVLEKACTAWVSTPSFINSLLLLNDFNSNVFEHLKTFIFCGEILHNTTASKLLSKFPNAKIYNTYGPTEATVATTKLQISSEILEKYKILPVGYVKRNTLITTDEITGELKITGPNVMTGYINSEKLNKQKMFYDGKVRTFLTGDVGFISSEGLIFCNGRIDNQIKLNGYRVDLDEIDGNIISHKLIHQCATIPITRNDGKILRIISFITTNIEDVNFRNEIVQDLYLHLKKNLPPYMIPSEIIIIENIPMSNNNKKDKAKLQEVYLNK